MFSLTDNELKIVMAPAAAVLPDRGALFVSGSQPC
jgi:hypothetical protein